MSPRDLLLLSALYGLFTVAILIAGMMAGIAAPTVWRIEVQSCRGATCRTLPVSVYRWTGRFACQDRAARIAALADLTHLLPAGARVTARCVGVDGLPGA